MLLAYLTKGPDRNRKRN